MLQEKNTKVLNNRRTEVVHVLPNILAKNAKTILSCLLFAKLDRKFTQHFDKSV